MKQNAIDPRGNGNSLSVFRQITSADGSTWTILLTMPDGKSRLAGEGEAWTDCPLKPNILPL